MAEPIRTIRVEGMERIEPSTVISYTGLKAGDTVDQSRLSDALKSLYATGLFADVNLRQDGGELVVSVTENPVINEIAFEGNDKLKTEDLTNEIQLRARVVFTRTKVQADVERLLDLYRMSGRFSAKVDPKIIKLDQNRVNLVFEIDEGPKTLIRKINIIGNSHYDDDKLRTVIRSKEATWYRFLSSDDNYDPERLDFDRELLRRFYLNHGYADFRVDSAVAELAPDREGFFITFSVEEGERYKIGAINIENHLPDLKADLIKDDVALVKGDWYDASAVERNVSGLTTKINTLQIPFVEVKPRIDRDREQKTVAITFNIGEGAKSFIEQINIHGNVRTLDEVVRREMLFVEGDAYNVSKLQRSEQRIRDLNFFEKVVVTPSEGSAPDKAVLDVEVEEKSTGELSLGAGFSTTDGPLADFSIKEHNFLGKGQDMSLSTTIARQRTEYDFSFTEPYFLDRDLSAGVDLFHSTRDLQTESSYDQKQTGGGLRIGFPIAEFWRESIGYRLERNKISNVGPGASIYIQQQEGFTTSSAVSQRLSYDTRDSRLDPTEGMIARFDTGFAGLGGDTQYVSLRLGGTYYYPVLEKCVLSILGEGGTIFGWGGDDVRINNRFALGGNSLRGFKDSGVGPRDTATDDALGGNTFGRGSIEFEFPSGLPEELGVRLRAFSDIGSLWGLDDSGATIVDENAVRMSAGGGISWRSPMGPVRIDLSAPLIKKPYDQTEAFRFSFGTRF